jgi:hypothetical protein
MSAKMEAFLDWHEDNPHIYDGLVRLAREVKAAGFDRCSLRLLYERLRWESMFETEGEAYKMPNNWVPGYARLLMHLEPDEFGDMFETARCVWWPEDV